MHERQLEAAIDKYDPKIAALGRKALALMRKRAAGALEMVYDNYNALGVGFSGVDKSSKIPLSIVLYPRWITLFFIEGRRPARSGAQAGGQGIDGALDPDRDSEGAGGCVRGRLCRTS